MRSLFIDTASSRIILGLLEGHQLVNMINEENDHSLSSRIFPLIDRLFYDAQWSVDDIKRIYVVIGPGSFTGIRIGVTIAKTFAWAKNLEIIPLSELELLATTPHSTDYLVPYIDARREAVYAGIYKADRIVMDDAYISINSLKAQYPNESIVAVSYDQCDLGIEQIKPEINISKIVEKHEQDASKNPHEVNPVYLKLTEAEENLNRDSKNV